MAELNCKVGGNEKRIYTSLDFHVLSLIDPTKANACVDVYLLFMHWLNILALSHSTNINFSHILVSDQLNM